MSLFRAILMYHSLDDSGSVISLPPDVFRRQMRSLFERGIPTVTPRRLFRGELEDPNHPAVALTFDDGFANFYTEAFPALSDYNLKATVFLVPGGCGNGRDNWSGGSREMLTWSRVEELRRAGIEIGAHTMTHARLTSLGFERAREEVLASKCAIEDRIGGPVTTFAYPYGAESKKLRRLVAENFEIGCSTRLGYIQPSSPPESLERIDAYYLRDLFWFRRLFRRSTGAYLVARGALRSCRRLVLGPS